MVRRSLIGSFSKVKVMGNPLNSAVVGFWFSGNIESQFAQLPPAISQSRFVLGRDATSPAPAASVESEHPG